MIFSPTRSERAFSSSKKVVFDLARQGLLAAAESLRSLVAGRGMAMKIPTLLCLLAGILLPGCTLCQNAKRTVLGEPSEFSWMHDRKESVEVYRCWADSAWREQCSSDPEQRVSSAYVGGFKDGFVDYVYAGGSGEPPPVPPRQFWNVDLRNPRGHVAATDWFAGFRHGSQVAREEGYRDRAIIPATAFRSNSRRNCRAEGQGCFDSTPAPIAGVGQPEFMPLGRQEPEASSGVSAVELPELENPAAQLPRVRVQVPRLEVQADEPMPLPQTIQEKAEVPVEVPPQLSEPNSTEPEIPRALPPFGDIFDSSALNQISIEPRALLQTNFEEERAEPQNVKVEQALSAFSSAIQGRSVAKQVDAEQADTEHLGNAFAAPVRSHSEKTMTKTTTLRQSAASSAPRPTTPSWSDDRATEMFPRFSR